jgi:hypothetical protein
MKEADRALVAIDEKTTLASLPEWNQRSPKRNARPRWADLQDASSDDWSHQGQSASSQNDAPRTLMQRQVGHDTRSRALRNQWHASQLVAVQPRTGTSFAPATRPAMSKESPF